MQKRSWRDLFLILLCLYCAPLAAEHVKVTVLATTDLHGNMYPFDYYTNTPSNRGLAKIATLIRAARAANPNNLLIDCGDTIQGTALEYVYQTYIRTGSLPLKLTFAGEPLTHDPMMLAMNTIGYDAMVVGNHEFQYGLKNLDRARSEARFPWLSNNTVLAAAGGKPFDGYLLKTVGGVKVAVIGFTTSAVPTFEKPENIAPYHFETARVSIEKSMAELRALPVDRRPDLIVVAAHAGLGRDTRNNLAPEGDPGENPMYDIAANIPGIDAIVFGHTHFELAELKVNGVLMNQPKNWGFSLGELTFELDSKPGGGFTVVKKSSRVIPATAQTVADAETMRIAKPYHELAERYLNTVVAQSDDDIDSNLGRVADTALVDAVQAVQLYHTHADVSFSALFNPRIKVPKGPVTVRQIAGLYLYDNELYAIEGTGKMVKDALENAARYYLSCSGETCLKGPLINTRVIAYNYDMAEGVDYEIDLTQSEGSRIRNLKWKGRPLAPDQKLRIALNNYRAGGSAGYSMFKGAKVVWRSSEDMRSLMIDYYTERGKLPSKPTGNWRIIPPEAAKTLERYALEDARRTFTR